MSKKNKYYVVWQGVEPGIYSSWAACQQQIKGYPGARYKSFKTREEAEAAFGSSYDDFIEDVKKEKNKLPAVALEKFREDIVWDSIAVDAACSGNPGVMEYQGVDTQTGMRLFHQKFVKGTNNIGEFLALVHGLAQLQKENRKIPIYTDSKIAMNWVQRKHCGSKLKRTPQTKHLFDLVRRAEQWLKTNAYDNEILKWKTDLWGEIPADFGRK